MSDTSGSAVDRRSVAEVKSSVLAQDPSVTASPERFRHPQRPRFGIPIAYKLALAITLLITLGMGLLGFVVVTNQQQLMRDQLNDHGETVAQQLADAATEPVLSGDRLSLSVLMKNVAENAGIYGAGVLSDKGETLAKTGLLPVSPIDELYTKSTRLDGGSYGGLI